MLVEAATFGQAPSTLLLVSSLAAAHIPTYLVKRGDRSSTRCPRRGQQAPQGIAREPLATRARRASASWISSFCRGRGLLVVQAPQSVVEAAWVPNLDPLPRFALGGLLAGYLHRTHAFARALGLPLGALLGVEAITYVYAQVAVVGSLSERVDWLGGRVSAWLDTIVGGGVSNDPLVFALAMAPWPGCSGWSRRGCCSATTRPGWPSSSTAWRC